MKTTVYNSQTREQVTNAVLSLAKAFGVLSQCANVERDALYSVETFEEIALTCGRIGKPFFFAIRERGTEAGTLEHVKERCKALGSPVCVIKIEDEAPGLFTFKVRTK